jgi:hypothetical protein
MAQWGRTDKPPVGAVVKVWYVNAVILAVWDGQRWHTPEGDLLREYISHWYPQ